MVGLAQFPEGLRAQLAVLGQPFIDQPAQQVALLFEHLLALLEEAHLAGDLQQGALGRRDGEALLHRQVSAAGDVFSVFR